MVFDRARHDNDFVNGGKVRSNFHVDEVYSHTTGSREESKVVGIVGASSDGA